MSDILAHCNKYLEYDNGTLKWKAKAGSQCTIGDEASRKRKDGYRQTKIKGIYYQTHRLIWLMHNGDWPVHTIDHINRVRDDNRIENLRDVTMKENLQNVPAKGYYFCNRAQKWIKYVKKVYGGRFDTEAEVIAACQ